MYNILKLLTFNAVYDIIKAITSVSIWKLSAIRDIEFVE